MDLIDVEAVARPSAVDLLPPWRPGDAPLAGGTWLFSEPQPGLRRLVDLAGLGWDRLAIEPDGLHIGAMCPIARLAAFDPPPAWPAAALFRRCADSLVASFKVQSQATVGGNLCLALPAGAMIALAVALDGTCHLRAPGGTSRDLPAADFVTGVRQTALRPGELLQRITLPAAALAARPAFRRVSLSPQGRTGAMVIGTRQGGVCRITITGSVSRPLVLEGTDRSLAGAAWHQDVHGALDWRQHVTALLADEVRAELA